MATNATAVTPLVRRPTAVETVAIVAPHRDDTGYADALHRRGWRSVAVIPQPLPDPPGRTTVPAGRYTSVVAHTTGLRHTVKRLRSLDVGAVLAGSEQGVELAERIARKLALPGSAPETAQLRTDRGAQAAALRAAGLNAPRSVRTESLREALQWRDFSQIDLCELLPDAVGAPVDPVLCRRRGDIVAAWTVMRRLAHQFAGHHRLVLREHLPGRHYLVHSVTHACLGGPPEHRVTDIWAQTSTPNGWPARLDLVDPHGLLARSLSLYTTRVLDLLGVACGPTTCRVVNVPERGPALLSARPVAMATPADDALRASTGWDRMGDAVDSVLPSDPLPTADVPSGHHVVRTLLHAPHDGAVHPLLLRVVAALPTVVRIDDRLSPLAAVRATTGPATVAGEVVLSGAKTADIEVAYRVIRALETAGLYEGGRR
ncbi:hypothetical protein OG800_49910 (plasmid) [Streptomyces sp. NBC_00445]|uniref:hypothetical protein n=1 Tax=Streptomyces sp. NBC_00445 TaxID=2975745 RepID=UPI002E1F9B2C